MSSNIIQLNEDLIKNNLKDLVVCDTVKVPTVIVQNSPSHRGYFPIKSGAP